MLRRGISRALKPQCRNFTASTRVLRSIPALKETSLEAFQKEAFNPALPTLLPDQFKHIPAIKSWFSKDSNGSTIINSPHLSRFGSTIVPVEITHNGHFARIAQPLSSFLEATASSKNNSNTQIYLAQAELSHLPKDLLQDIPVPSIVLQAGKGDIYNSSLWIGRAPTYTPLHRDPNPNLFVQLAGRKVVRMLRPNVGLSIFENVQERIGGVGNASMRGVEMMEGVERKVLEDEVWENDSEECWDAEVGSGDGLFIPKGWWHSIKSAGDEEGVIGSVNWWFR